MPIYYNHDLWWGYAGWNAFGWWEGENPFKGWWNGEGEHWHDADIAYVKSLDGKGEEKTYSEPKDGRALFIAQDFEQALNALEEIATSFSLEYEDGTIKLYAWNEEKPEFKACLMMKYDWGDWCDSYRYSKEMERVLEYSYGINAPDPIFKEGKLAFGDKFEKTPEEFIHDMASNKQEDGNGIY